MNAILFPEPVSETAAVEPAAPADRDRLVDVMTLAFAADPVARWMYPDPQQYLGAFPAFVRAFGGGAVDHGSAHHVADYAGAALWLPPGAEPDEQALVPLLERSVGADRLPVVFELLQLMGQQHPPGPHWYLPMIGVDPARQRRGLGAALLRHAVDRLDRERQVAYLESTNPANVPLYRRHGFEVTATIRAGDAPPLLAMVRPAR